MKKKKKNTSKNNITLDKDLNLQLTKLKDEKLNLSNLQSNLEKLKQEKTKIENSLKKKTCDSKLEEKLMLGEKITKLKKNIDDIGMIF